MCGTLQAVGMRRSALQRNSVPHWLWLLIIKILLELICLLLNLEQKRSRLLNSFNFSDVQVRPEEMKEELTKEDLDKRVDIYLTEMETLWIFDMPSVMVSVEAEDAGRVQYVYWQLFVRTQLSTPHFC